MREPDVHRELIAFLRLLGRQLRLRSSLQTLARTAWLALAACAVVLLAGRLWPVDGYRLAAIGLLAAWLIGWAIYSLVRRMRPFAVARRADVELELRDRLSTALTLSQPDRPVSAGFDRALVSLQFDDALAVAGSIEPRRAFPTRIERAWLWRAAAALLAGVILFALPNPMDAIVAERAQIAQIAETEAAKLEELAKEVEENADLDPKEKEQLLRQLREMIEQLRANPGDAKQALADLARLQEQLRARLDPAAASEAAAIDALAQQLAQLAEAKDMPKDAAEAAKLLEQLASELDKVSPEQREALAGALERAAAQTAGGNPALARALADMAQAAREGATGQQLQRAAAQAGQALRQAANAQALQQAVARALNQAEASQRAIAQAARNQGQGSQGTQSAQANQGQGQRQGQGQGNQGARGNQGQGQGNSQGQGQPGGGGSQANTLPPGVSSGQAGQPTDPSKPYTTGDLDTVYAPIDASQGSEEFVEGQQTDSGQTTVEEGQSPQPGANNPALVPYSQVFQQYAQIAAQAIERAYVPLGLRDYVKEYFINLEP